MTSCNFYNKKGEPSKLYEKLESKYGANKASKIFDLVNQHKEDLGFTELDEDGEVLMSDITKSFIDELVGTDVVSTTTSSEVKSTLKLLVDDTKLIDTKNSGILMSWEVSEDNISDSVITPDVKTSLNVEVNLDRFNKIPTRNRLGHIIARLIPKADRARVIELAKKDSVYDLLSKVGDSFTPEDFDIELFLLALTNDEFKNSNPSIKIMQDKIIADMAKTFNKTVEEVSDFIKYNMLIQDYSILINTLHANKLKRLSSARTIKNKVTPLVELTQKLKLLITKKIKVYYSSMTEEDKNSSSTYQHLKALQDMFEDYKTTQNVEAILGFVVEMSSQIGKIESRINSLENDLALGNGKVTDESLHRLAQYISIFDTVKDVYTLMSEDNTFKAELEKAYEASDVKKFKAVKAYIADLMARNEAVKSKTRKLTNLFLADVLIQGGKSRTVAKYEEIYGLEFKRKNPDKVQESKKNNKSKREFEAEQKNYIDSRLKSNRVRIKEEEAQRISDLLEHSPKDISLMERLFLDRNTLNDDLVQIVSEMIDKAEYNSDIATVEVYKDLYQATDTFESDVRDSLNQAEKYKEFLEPNINYDVDTDFIEVTNKKINMLTSKYYSKVFEIESELVKEYVSALKSGNAVDIDEYKFKLDKFVRDNFDTPYSDAYYNIIDSLRSHPEAYTAFNNYRIERNLIIRPYRHLLKQNKDLPPNAQAELKQVDAKYDRIFSIYNQDGTRKTGIEADIALRIKEFRKKFSSMYEEGFKSLEFQNAREAAVQAGKEEEFLAQNTNEIVSKEFYYSLKKITDLDPDVANAYSDYKKSVKAFKEHEAQSSYTKDTALQLKDTVELHANRLMQAIKDTPFDAVRDFFSSKVTIIEDSRVSSDFKSTILDSAFIQAGKKLPLFFKFSTTDAKYKKFKPKKKWYGKKLKALYLKTGYVEGDPITPKDKWLNPNYQTIQNDSKLKQAYDTYVKTIRESDSYLLPPDRLIKEKDGEEIIYLPSVARSSMLEVIGEQGIFNYVKNKVQRFKENKATEPGFGTDLDTADTIESDLSLISVKEVNRDISVLVNEKGEEYRAVPVNYRFKGEQEEMSLDIPTLLVLNYKMSRNYKEKTDIMFIAELVKDSIAERTVAKTNNPGLYGFKTYIDALSGKGGKAPVVEKGSESNTYKALQSIVDDRIYGLSSTSSYKMAQIANVISKYTADVLLIGNYMSAGVNVITGQVYNFIEAAAGRHFNDADLRRAQAKYYMDSLHILKDIGNRTFRSKTNLLNEKFTILADWTSVGARFMESTKFTQLFKFNTWHALSNMGEHNIQSTTGYAVLNHIKVKNKDGKYINKEGKEVESVTEAMSLDEAYKVDGNRLVLHPDAYYTTKHGTELNLLDNLKEIEFDISRLVRDINADLQGQYNPTMKAEVQRAWWGQLIFLLRKFAPRGVTRRFRGFSSSLLSFEDLQEDDRFYSRAQGVYNEGHYTTSIRLGAELFRDAKELKWKLLSFQGLGKLNTLRKAKIDNMEDWQKSNLKKTTREIILAGFLYVFAMTMANLKDDEDDETKKKLYVIAAFYGLRSFKELTTFVNPDEMLQTLRTPSIALTMVNRLMILLGQMGSDTISLATTGDFQRYKTGRREGETKLYKKIEDMVPLLKNLDRDMEEALSWFLNRRAY